MLRNWDHGHSMAIGKGQHFCFVSEHRTHTRSTGSEQGYSLRDSIFHLFSAMLYSTSTKQDVPFASCNAAYSVWSCR